MDGSALLTDAGSVKEEICREIETDWQSPARFVGSHPLAGSEKTGFEHADADLYEGRVCVVTPTASTRNVDAERIGDFWEILGARVFELTPEDHDRALAATSHLPHLISATLAGILRPEHGEFAATGYRDTTRIAAGDPDLWTGIFLQNRDHLLASAGRFEAQLKAFQAALKEGDVESLKNLLETAKRNRDSLNL